MIKCKIVWSDKSLYDLEDAYDLITEKSITAANQTVESIINNADLLINFPKSGAIEPRLLDRKKEYRYLVQKHHKIIYRIEDLKVLIVRVFDTRKSPDNMKP